MMNMVNIITVKLQHCIRYYTVSMLKMAMSIEFPRANIIGAIIAKAATIS